MKHVDELSRSEIDRLILNWISANGNDPHAIVGWIRSVVLTDAAMRRIVVNLGLARGGEIVETG